MRLSRLTAFLLFGFGWAIAANATTLLYSATLSGLNESPVNASPGTGSVLVTVDDVSMTMRVQATFQDLLGTTTASHIHCCTAASDTGNAGVATATPSFPLFPLGVTSGSYDNVFDMTLASSYNASFLNSAVNSGNPLTAFTTLLGGLDAGTSYFNVHTSLFPSGEVRGFLHSAPEPGSLALMCLGLFGIAKTRMRKLLAR